MTFAMLELGRRLDRNNYPVEPKPSLRVPPFHSNLSDGLESDGSLLPTTTTRVRGSRVRKPRGVFTHAHHNEMRQTIQRANQRGCNASSPNKQYSGSKSPAPEGFIPAWRLRPGVSYVRPIRTAFSFARWVRLPHTTKGMRQEGRRIV